MKITWLDNEKSISLEAQTQEDAFMMGRLGGLLGLQKDKFNGYSEGVYITVSIYDLINSVLKQKEHNEKTK